MKTPLQCAALLLFSLAAAFVQAQPTAIISFSEKRVSPGETITATIQLKNMPNVYGVQLSGQYNTDYLKLQTSEKPAGLTLQAFLTKPQAFTIKNSVNEKSGSFELIHALLHPEKEVSGNGTLATIHFIAQGEGQAALALETLKFGTKDGQVIEPAIVNNAQVSITAISALNIQVMLTIAALAILLIGLFIATWLTAKKVSRKTPNIAIIES